MENLELWIAGAVAVIASFDKIALLLLQTYRNLLDHYKELVTDHKEAE